MKLQTFICCFLLSTNSIAQNLSGDFDGDGKKETAKHITIREPYAQGGYDPVYIPGEYRIEFSNEKFYPIHLGESSLALSVIHDFNKNKKDELILYGRPDVALFEIARVYEYIEGIFQVIAQGNVPVLLKADAGIEKMLFTKNDSVWFISDQTHYDSIQHTNIHCRLIHPVIEENSERILPGHKFYPEFEKYIITQDEITPPVYQIDTIPSLQDQTFKTLKNYISMNLKYPQIALEEQIEGVVKVTFMIDEYGKIQNLEILNKAHPYLADEAKKLYNNAPLFKPILHNGKPVRVKVRDQVKFRIN